MRLSQIKQQKFKTGFGCVGKQIVHVISNNNKLYTAPTAFSYGSVWCTFYHPLFCYRASCSSLECLVLQLLPPEQEIIDVYHHAQLCFLFGFCFVLLSLICLFGVRMCECISVCAYLCVCMYITCTVVFVWKSEANFQELVLFFHCLDPRNWTQFAWLAVSAFTHWALTPAPNFPWTDEKTDTRRIGSLFKVTQ